MEEFKKFVVDFRNRMGKDFHKQNSSKNRYLYCKKNQSDEIFKQNEHLVQNLKYLCLFACIIFEDQESIDAVKNFELQDYFQN